MTADDLSARIGTLSDKAVDSLSGSVSETQTILYKDMEKLLMKMEVDSNGLLLQNTANRKLLFKVDQVFNKSMKSSGYYESLDNFTDSFGALTKTNQDYFKSILDTFTVDAHYIKSLQNQSIAEIETLLANDGLETILKAPLKQILNTNVNTGAGLSDMLGQVREFIKGTPELEGKLMRYSKQITRDSLFNYNASLQESVSANAGMDFYYYQGHKMADSREFCLSRYGKYFHKKEVEAWGNLTWQGQRAGTNSSTIFIYRGGYNCLHQLIPVSEIVVPKSVIKRAKAAGYIK